MHAVVVRSTLHDVESGLKFLREEAAPRLSQAPGFVAAYWVKLEGNQGTSMLFFESEEAARAAAEQINPPAGAVTIDSRQIGEVVHHI